MPFPNLVPMSDSSNNGGIMDYFAEGEGVPDDGDNTFEIPFIGLGVRPAEVNPEHMKLFIERDPANPGVGVVSFVSLSPDKTMMTLNFEQAGAGVCKVTVQLQHSVTR